MKCDRLEISLSERASALKNWLDQERRLGAITSIDGSQLITLVLDPFNRQASVWETPLDGDCYPSLAPEIPQCHWSERTIWDMFGLRPQHHPRLKHNILHEAYEATFTPLRGAHCDMPAAEADRQYHHLEVKGDGVFEIPVGPIHAGIIEPGHFRFSCLGEVILNLEIRLGYVHRGIEKRLTEVDWQKARFVAESAAGDMSAANALAHAVALESMLEIEAPPRAEALRTLSLEIERVAMHIADLGGIAGDIGFLAVSSSMARLRGSALGMGELLAGSRFQKAFICPGGIASDITEHSLKELARRCSSLKDDLEPVLRLLFDNQAACERMRKVGRLSPKLASDFGLVGVAGRASGVEYDARAHFKHGLFPQRAPEVSVEKGGDVFSRALVRRQELLTSLALIEQCIDDMPEGRISSVMPERLPEDQIGLGIVESHRGELIHLLFSDRNSRIKRYAIKDPSLNNWTGLAIAIRNNLVADFPLCNKSFSLSYSGHDL